jgi:hypothetical protein
MTIEVEKYIRDYGQGKYLNPRNTHGWKEEWIDIVDMTPCKETLYDLIEEQWGTDEACNVIHTLNAKRGKVAKEEYVYDVLSRIFKVNAVGLNGKRAYDFATKHYDKMFNRLLAGQYENKAALKWEYISPEWTVTWALQKGKDTYYVNINA